MIDFRLAPVFLVVGATLAFQTAQTVASEVETCPERWISIQFTEHSLTVDTSDPENPIVYLGVRESGEIDLLWGRLNDPCARMILGTPLPDGRMSYTVNGVDPVASAPIYITGPGRWIKIRDIPTHNDLWVSIR